MTEQALTYRLRLKEPVLVAQAQAGEENSATSLGYVPGSTIRGVLVGRYLKDTADPDVAGSAAGRRLFFDESVCYLNAYPYRVRTRLLPSPLSWLTEKDQACAAEGVLYDTGAGGAIPEQPKAPSQATFCAIVLPEDELDWGTGDALPRALLCEPQRQINVHIGLREVNVRSEDNDVYRYVALAADQVLVGAIVGPADALAQLRRLLDREPTLHLGTARTAGYGRVELEDVRIGAWEEYLPAPAPDGFVVVTLLSHTILRNPQGQVDGDLDGAVARLLGLPSLKAHHRFQRMTPFSGFNRKWGLPLPQNWALAAGSVAVYDAADVEADALRAAVAAGIGERRAEGFGRVAVNWHTWPRLAFHRPLPSKLTRPRLKDEESVTLARRMAERRLTLLLDRGLVAAVSKADLTGTLPSNSQLSQVRLAAQQALHSRSLAALGAHCDALKETRRRRTAFERARVDGAQMLKWMQALLEKRDVELLLPVVGRLPQVAGQSAGISEELKTLYTARLIEGVMRKAIRKNQETER